jgi:hypothetical protein
VEADLALLRQTLAQTRSQVAVTTARTSLQ